MRIISYVLIMLFFCRCGDKKNIDKEFEGDVLRKEVYHLKSDLDSIVTYYYSQNIKEVYKVENGLREGLYTLYEDSKGLIKKKTTYYRNGLKDGEENIYINGSLKESCFDYENGALKRKVIFVGSDTLAVLTLKSSVLEYLNNEPYVLRDTLGNGQN